MATAYAEGMTRREMVEAHRARMIAKANVRSAEEEDKPSLKREDVGLDMKALERFRKNPVKKQVRAGSITTSEDGEFSDNEED
jgi:hypothetical protein